MYNNSSTQYPNSGYQASSYQQYPTDYGTPGYNYQDYGQYTGNQQPQLPQSTPGQWTSTSYGTPQIDAVAHEMQQQKAQLIKQREEYVSKVSVLRRELEQLRLQKQQLSGDGHHSYNILRENDKLQDEIQGKMKAIQNVIEMLSGIIKDGKSVTDLEAMLPSNDKEKLESSSVLNAEANNKHHKKEVISEAKIHDGYNYVHYDTGLHWCRMCDEFPETAKDYLLHLQDKSHRLMIKENDVDSTPWHKLSPEPVLPSDENAPTKRVPIKGLQFFIAAPSWYCKLCDIWIGDLHCASHHLKSKAHFQNYENFVSQNPHWEMEWLKDRENSMARKNHNSSDSDEPEKKKRRRKDKKHSHDGFSIKEKKKKRRSKKHRKQSSESSSSSSSSDSSSDEDRSDRSKSIRVAMRNMKQVQSIMEEDLSGKWSVLEKLVEEHKKKQEIEKQEKKKQEIEKQDKKTQPEDPLINQWMTVTPTQDKDRQLLENLKDRMRQKQEQERIKQAEIEKKNKERERLELERLQQKLRKEKEAAEEAERERKRKEQEEYERIRDKERNQVRFKPNVTNYRRRRSDSRSDDEEEPSHKYREESNSKVRQRSRSPSVDRKSEESNEKKKPPGPPSYKKLPFIGRMPLFKNKKTVAEEREEKKKEIQKESYEIPRRTRFEPGNLPRAFIPRPDVVCFPKLSSIPPLTIPPPPTVSMKVEPQPPEPPKISQQKVEKEVVEEEPEAPPPPKLNLKEDKSMNLSDDEVLYANPGEGMDPSMMGQYYQNYQNMMYSSHEMYSYDTESSVPHSHTMPLQPPPLPPDDDLALLGICADDMAAQSF